jgi:hypothetical protein
MDLISITRDKIERAGDGDHAAGLKAVLLHIETAVSHLNRGQETSDETAFTDAIYRTNQAFEGSLKEAYRVLTGKKPEKKTPYQIEEYFTTNDVFRSRVLAQFKNYRTEWRNPSTHDYKLDFDSAEAFLAIVSVCAFANLLLDQVIEKLAHDRSKLVAESERDRLHHTLRDSESDMPLFVAHIITEFLRQYQPKQDGPRMREAELLGALSGFIDSVAPDIKVGVEVPLAERGPAYADLLLDRAGEKLLIELKGMKFSKALVRAGLDQLDRYMVLGDVKQGVLVVANPPFETVEVSDTVTPSGHRVVVVAPEPLAT